VRDTCVFIIERLCSFVVGQLGAASPASLFLIFLLYLVLLLPSKEPAQRLVAILEALHRPVGSQDRALEEDSDESSSP